MRVFKKSIENKTISFNYTIEGDVTDKKMRILLVIEQRITSVKSGENRNRVLRNANVVVVETYVDVNSKIGTINIPDIVKEKDDLRLVALIENSNFDITGANQLQL